MIIDYFCGYKYSNYSYGIRNNSFVVKTAV